MPNEQLFSFVIARTFDKMIIMSALYYRGTCLNGFYIATSLKQQ